MSPAVTNYKGLNFKVKLPSNLFFSNYPATIQNIQVDFSDGLGFRIVGYDQLVDVKYTQPNTYNWIYKITLTNRQTMLSQSKVTVENGLNATLLNATPLLLQTTTVTSSAAAIINQPQANLSGYYKTTINSTIQYLGYNASATVYIKFANGGTSITKPLIVAEGFDDGIILHPEQEAGSNTIEDFLTSIRSNNSGSFSLYNEINTYDIIYVDWNNGVTFLQRNAYVLEEVIKWVNQTKITTTQNVVIGQSMGGLIAQYALKDMETRGLNHDTRLYVSHDAPHLGANTPISVQLSARHLRNLYVSTPIPFTLGEIVIPLIYDFAQGFSSIINLFGGNTSVPAFVTPLQAFSLADTPASRQMTYNWVNINYGINNVIHDAWQQDLALKGYPVGYATKPIRNIAIANGSECGITQTDNGNIMSYIKDAGRDTFLSNYIGILDAVYGAFITNPIIVAVSLFPGSSYWRIDFQSKYITILNQNKNIYHGYIGYKKKIFWFIPISIAVTEVDVNQPTGVLPYDIYGGGQVTTPSNSLPLSGITSNTFGFIPTASSLDIGAGTTPINDADYRRTFVGAQPPTAPKNSPFQNFVTGFVPNNPTSSNSRHISFNKRNGDWLKKELIPSTQYPIEYTDCSYICSGVQISGNETLCTTNVYNVPTGATTYNWTITEGANLVTLTGNGTPNISLTNANNGDGFVTIQITYGDNWAKCGNVTLTKRIWIGVPQFNEFYFYNGQTATMCIAPIDYLTTSLPSHKVKAIFDGMTNSEIFVNSNWEWETENNLIVLNGTKDTRTICPMETGYSSFSVRAKNACGWSEWFQIPQFEITLPPTNFMRQSSNTYTIYPNPTKDIVNIDLRNQNNKPDNEAIISGELFDMIGQSKSKVEISNNKATFSVRGLNKGIYVLKIYINDQVESHQIAVE